MLSWSRPWLKLNGEMPISHSAGFRTGQLDECLVSGALCAFVWARECVHLARPHTGETDKCVNATVCFRLFFLLPLPVSTSTSLITSASPSSALSVFWFPSSCASCAFSPFLKKNLMNAFPRNTAYCLLPLLELCSTTDKHAEIGLSRENMPAGYDSHPRLRFLSTSHIFRSAMKQI